MSQRLAAYAIDDDPADLRILERHLLQISEWEIDLTVFSDSTPAFVEIFRAEPDILFLDYRIGGKNGLDVLKLLRSSGFDGPVIFLTGQGDEDLAVAALQTGASDYIRKSTLSSQVLYRSMSSSLEKTALRKALESHRAELARSNQSLTSRNEEIQRFYQTLSHELKTPLTVIREYVSMVNEGVAGETNSQQREFLGTALRSCDRMVTSINDLLDVTRLDTGKLKLQPRALSIRDVLESTVAALAPLARSQGISLECRLAPGLSDTHADEERLVQMLTNLVNNAVKFTSPGGSIVLEARDSGEHPGHVEVLVRDTGRGIPRKDLDLIFDRLYQCTDDDATSQRGLGIGLHLCRELVRLHGGEMDVESAVGEGTTFRFWIPKHMPMRTLAGRPNKEGVVS